jgi:hypothetical protein
MKSRNCRIAGWVLSILLAAFLIFASAIPKFTEWEGKELMLNRLGYSSDLISKIGIVEIAVALLFVIPRTSFLGAVLQTGYLGGATATHVRVGDPFYFPIVMGVIAWVAYGLRRPAVFSLITGSSSLRTAGDSRCARQEG